eukprot:SAG31_NODE_8256_length_1487_cov_3.587642_1_plen_207_part_00
MGCLAPGPSVPVALFGLCPCLLLLRRWPPGEFRSMNEGTQKSNLCRDFAPVAVEPGFSYEPTTTIARRPTSSSPDPLFLPFEPPRLLLPPRAFDALPEDVLELDAAEAGMMGAFNQRPRFERVHMMNRFFTAAPVALIAELKELGECPDCRCGAHKPPVGVRCLEVVGVSCLLGPARPVMLPSPRPCCCCSCCCCCCCCCDDGCCC